MDDQMDHADNLGQNQVALGNAMNLEHDENLTEAVIEGSKLNKGKAKIDYDGEALQNEFKDVTSGPVNSDNQNSSNFDSSLHDGNDDDDDLGCDTSDYGSDDFMYDEEEDDRYSAMQSEFFDNVDLPPGVEASVPWLTDFASIQSNSESKLSNKKLDVENKINDASTSSLTTVQAEPSSIAAKEHENTEVLIQRVKDFKQFDTVEDFSDHHYCRMGFKEGAPPKEWAKKIQAEWKIMEKNLPDTIFVRVYEARMELLRAVIVGPSGTPYHDGLFVFDCFFPPNYPAAPPTVYYYSGGLRLNPNLYDCGKVCLSLLGTWPGKQTEMWNPNQSTMLQVLVSIQALILNANPFFNEPGYERAYTGQDGKRRSEEYNEDVFILSLKTMMYTVRRPPKHFEVLVTGHFRIRARDILLACKAYMEGALVGSLVVKDGAVTNSEKSSKSRADFKAKIGKLMNALVSNFAKNGSTDVEEFRSS